MDCKRRIATYDRWQRGPFRAPVRVRGILAMLTSSFRYLPMIVALSLPGALAAQGEEPGEGWIDLTGSNTFAAWKSPTEAWAFVGNVHLDPDNPKRLVAEPGSGVLYNGPTGRTRNLVTREDFGDLEAHVEFLIPKGSNSGVKFG